jgi:hypothetical protein
VAPAATAVQSLWPTPQPQRTSGSTIPREAHGIRALFIDDTGMPAGPRKAAAPRSAYDDDEPI